MTFTIITKSKLQKQCLEKTSKIRKKNADKVAIAAATSTVDQNDLASGISIIWIKLAELKPADRRVRKVSDGHIAQAVRAIRQFGFVSPIITRGGRVVDGHTRLRAAEELSLGSVPCIDVSHLSSVKARLLSLSLNRLAETGEWDLDELKLELAELEVEGLDLTLTGFSEQELDIILHDEKQDQTSDAQEPIETLGVPITKLGDVWLLDKHRLLCGDALTEASYTLLMNGKVAAAVQTDPPFNVKIAQNVSGLGKKTHGEFEMASGEMSTQEFTAFLNRVHNLLTSHLMEGGVAYVFIDWRSVDLVMAAGRNAGLEHIGTAVWYKGSGSMGAFLRSAHELVCIFCKGARPKINNIQLGKHGRDRTNVWAFPGANKPGTSAAEALKDHPTPKNVEMCMEAMLDVTHRGDIVLDPFLGSGTSLIAAERSSRICYGMELDPKYVDVCIRRWEKLTGKTAVHGTSGLTYQQITEAADDDGDDNDQ